MRVSCVRALDCVHVYSHCVCVCVCVCALVCMCVCVCVAVGVCVWIQTPGLFAAAKCSQQPKAMSFRLHGSHFRTKSKLLALICFALLFFFALLALLRVALLTNSSKMNKSSIFSKQQPAAGSQQLEASSCRLEVCFASPGSRRVKLATSLAQPIVWSFAILRAST